MHIFYFGKVLIMPKKYTPEVQAKAVRLVRGHVDDYASEWEASKTVANRLARTASLYRSTPKVSSPWRSSRSSWIRIEAIKYRASPLRPTDAGRYHATNR